MKRAALCLAVLWSCAPQAGAQTSSPPPSTIGGVAVSGSVRARAYSWNWFGADAAGEYAYPAAIFRLAAAPRSSSPVGWRIELAAPVVMALPSTAATPPPAGQLGLGAAYYAANANSSTAAAVFLKQAFVRFDRLGGISGQSLNIGRFEFNDGAEVVPKDATLAALKRDRISQRLIGTFVFTDVGRSIDGAAYGLTTGKLNVTALAGRPTQGVFDVNGWPELGVNLFYGALTGSVGAGRSPGEFRVFAIGYDDYRHGVAKVDNRPQAVRNADGSSIAVATIGGHYIQTAGTTAGPVDVLVWAAVQTGSWGALAQRAGAFATEIGWQPRAPERLRLWIRGGYDYGSGDANPGDGTHGTFFQVLPTPRIYARLPFFNMMNDRDAFAALAIRPSPRVAVRTDVHALALADENDLWYSGGGAFERGSFGYAGRPSNRATGLATLYDASADWTVTPHASLNAYLGYARPGDVPRAVYHTSDGVTLGYVELLLRF